MSLPLWFEVGSLVVITLVLILDLMLVVWRPHHPSNRESALWITFYVVLALIFGGFLFAFAGEQYGAEFLAGWVTEYSLSIDNLFVFVLIMARFYVPRELQQYVLMWGIIIALVLRGVFIALGAAILAQFSWVFYLFGIFLIVTAFKLLTHGEDDDEEYKENIIVRMVGRIVPVSQEFEGKKLRTVVSGKRMFTPLLVVLIAIGTTDVLFALDSIPAIFGITSEAYLVFAVNAFALMGLRQLYFLLHGLLERLQHLNRGLAIILAFIGVKLLLEAIHSTTSLDVPTIPVWFSLLFIVSVLVVTAVTSVYASRDRAPRSENPEG